MLTAQAEVKFLNKPRRVRAADDLAQPLPVGQRLDLDDGLVLAHVGSQQGRPDDAQAVQDQHSLGKDPLRLNLQFLGSQLTIKVLV